MAIESPVASDPVVGQLEAARAILVQFGWCKGRFCTEDGRVCIVGAVWVDTDGEPNKYQQATIFELALVLNYRGLPSWRRYSKHIGTWNDAPDRVFDDVLALIDRAVFSRLRVIGDREAVA